MYAALPLLSATAGDAFNGKWKLSETKAKISGAHVREMEIEASDARVKIAYHGVDDSGQANDWSINARIGGDLSGVVDVPGLDAVRCWRSDERTFLLKLTRSAEAVGWDTLEISKDGKSLRLTHAVLDAKGKESKTVSLFTK
jgi:hypothetical protein